MARWSLAAAPAAFLFATLASGQVAPKNPMLRYGFASEKELADFEPIAGSWSVASGALFCASKGAREELRWRRELSASGSVEISLLGPAKFALAFGAGTEETLVRIDRGESRVTVLEGDRTPIERSFEAPAAGRLTLHVGFAPATLTIEVGDDEPLIVKRRATAPFRKLSLLALHSQPRVDEIAIERIDDASKVLAIAGEPSEELRLAIERATVLAGKDPEESFKLLAGALAAEPAAGKTGRVPTPALALFQRLGAAREALLAKPPLAELVAAATIAPKDGSVRLVRPLAAGWRAAAHEIRADGTVITLESDEPRVAVELFRYNSKIQYWFGREPKLVMATGGGGVTLGRARAEDQRDQHPKAEFTRPFDQSRIALGGLGGEAVHEYVLAWPETAPAETHHALRELFVLHRGDTWRVSIDGTPTALAVREGDLEWILATLRFPGD